MQPNPAQDPQNLQMRDEGVYNQGNAFVMSAFQNVFNPKEADETPNFKKESEPS